MIETYRIKYAEKNHLESLPSIEKAALENFSKEDIPLQLPTGVISAKEFLDAQSKDFLWVAVNESNIAVGFLLAAIIDNNFHIMEMDVYPEHGRKGIGTNLLLNVIKEAAARKYQLITLTTFKHLKWNALFYSRHGFKVFKQKQCGKELLTILLKEKQHCLKNRVATSLKLSLLFLFYTISVFNYS